MANPEIYSIEYETALEAGDKYGKIPEKFKQNMAEDYRDAFGGKPWFERYECNGTEKCGYLAEPFCAICNNGKNIKEAYPVTWLKEEYFPKMMGEFVPGILGIIQLGEEIPGFTTGGFTFLDILIQKKYSKNPDRILRSTTAKFNLKEGALVFYDNETCIKPEKQGSGLGPKLGEFRVEQAVKLEADVVCGRTINLPWLKTKEKQFTARGYQFDYFVPNGDNYSVEGNPRYFYVARMIK